MESSYFKIQYLELVRSFVEPKEPKTFVIHKTFFFSAFKWTCRLWMTLPRIKLGLKKASDCLTDRYDFIYSATAPFLFKRVLSLENYIGASAQQDMI